MQGKLISFINLMFVLELYACREQESKEKRLIRSFLFFALTLGFE